MSGVQALAVVGGIVRGIEPEAAREAIVGASADYIIFFSIEDGIESSKAYDVQYSSARRSSAGGRSGGSWLAPVILAGKSGDELHQLTLRHHGRYAEIRLRRLEEQLSDKNTLGDAKSNSSSLWSFLRREMQTWAPEFLEEDVFASVEGEVRRINRNYINDRARDASMPGRVESIWSSRSSSEVELSIERLAEERRNYRSLLLHLDSSSFSDRSLAKAVFNEIAACDAQLNGYAVLSSVHLQRTLANDEALRRQAQEGDLKRDGFIARLAGALVLPSLFFGFLGSNVIPTHIFGFSLQSACAAIVVAFAGILLVLVGWFVPVALVSKATKVESHV